MTALTITYDGNVPTVGADADTWGTEINTALGQVKVDLDAIVLTPANRLKGSVAGGGVDDLTGTQAATILPAVVGASQTVAGTKGLAPAASAGDQNKALCGDGTYKLGVGRAFGCVITTTSAHGSQPTLSGALNVASISTVNVSAGQANATLTFTNALASAAYAVHVHSNGSVSAGTAYSNKTTTTVVIYWSASTTTELSVSGF